LALASTAGVKQTHLNRQRRERRSLALNRRPQL